MRSYRPLAKIRFKSYSNRILIDFFKLSRQNRFQQMGFNRKWLNFRSKLQSSIQIRHWISKQTEIDDPHRRSKSTSLKSESSTIRVLSLYRISIAPTQHQAHHFFGALIFCKLALSLQRSDPAQIVCVHLIICPVLVNFSKCQHNVLD